MTDVLISDIPPAARRYLAQYVIAVELADQDVQFFEASPIYEGRPLGIAVRDETGKRLIVIDPLQAGTLEDWLSCLLHETYHHKVDDWSTFDTKQQIEVAGSGKQSSLIRNNAEETAADQFAAEKLHTWLPYANQIIRSFNNGY